MTWRRHEEFENSTAIRVWGSGQDRLSIIDVSDDAYYKVNYILQDQNSDALAYGISICNVAEEAIQEHGVIPKNSAWLDKDDGMRYIVKKPIPELLPDTDERHPPSLLEEPQVYVNSPDTDEEHIWVPRKRFQSDEIELLEWDL